ncbi:MAG TPA: hypothetical protein VGJ09_10440 [Bryobacteraceae bacterium]|jgi:hypothetical protein
MPPRIALLLPLVLLPLLAQTPSPEAAAADQALRARVTEFLQYHVEGNFRKAYDMVAADTQEDYFNNGKVQIKGFTVDSVRFSDNYTKASVMATMSRTMNVAGTEFPVMMPSTTTWKIEKDKWVWYKEPDNTPASPFGPASLPSAAGVAPPGPAAAALPQDFSDKTIAEAARSILQQVSVDKNEVTLQLDGPSEATVVLHNGMTGSVKVDLNAPSIPGFTAQTDQSMVRAAGNVKLLLRYQPGDHPNPSGPVNVQLTVQPLNQDFVIRVNFAGPAPQK